MEPIGLMHIQRITIPKNFIEGIYSEFQETGKAGYERLALFAGKKDGSAFQVTHVIYPKQYLRKGPLGVSFHIDGSELERIWDWLYENNCSLIGQIHSHPKEAYHSEADDQLAIITTFGGVSIVVPNFGNSDSNLNGSAFYRLLPHTGWTQLTLSEINSLIKIIE
jgi:proteasome lid subunit RPN8/RPN11